MSIRDIVELVLLAALWGGAFILMRVAAPEFGAIALAEVRIATAAVCLLPILLLRSGGSELMRRSKPLFLVGLVNTAIPFALFSYATIYLTGGFVSIVNASAPMWGAMIAWLWLGEHLSRSQFLGLIIGVVGVYVLVGKSVGIDLSDATIAIAAALAAAFFYGIGANLARKTLPGVDSLTIATGTLVGAALALLPPAIYYWPEAQQTGVAWLSAISMGVACTALAYILYFRLIARIGAARALSVTYLIPVFAVIWGATLIGEQLTIEMTVGCIIILLGTALGTGMLEIRSLNRKA